MAGLRQLLWLPVLGGPRGPAGVGPGVLPALVLGAFGGVRADRDTGIIRPSDGRGRGPGGVPAPGGLGRVAVGAKPV